MDYPYVASRANLDLETLLLFFFLSNWFSTVFPSLIIQRQFEKNPRPFFSDRSNFEVKNW